MPPFRREQRPGRSARGRCLSGEPATRRSQQLAAEVAEFLQIATQPAPAIEVLDRPDVITPVGQAPAIVASDPSTPSRPTIAVRLANEDSHAAALVVVEDVGAHRWPLMSPRSQPASYPNTTSRPGLR